MAVGFEGAPAEGLPLGRQVGRGPLPAPFAVRKLLERFSGRTVSVEFVPTMLDLVPQFGQFTVRVDNTDPWQMGGIYSYLLADYFMPLSVKVTAGGNPLQAMVVETSQGQGILGVIDGASPKGIETDSDVRNRKEFLRKIGYKR